MLKGNPLTGYGISNLELLLLLLGLGALVSAAFWLLRRRWRHAVRQSEAGLLEARQNVERLQQTLVEEQRQRDLETARLQRELDQVRPLYDPAEVEKLLERSERDIAHRFGSTLFDIAERCRETALRVRADQPDVRIALNEIASQTREMLHRTKVIVGAGSPGRRKPVWETLRVRQVLESVVKEQLAYAESRGVCLLTDYSSVGPVLTDRLLLHDLCEVVIQNAIKFSPEFTGVVRITLRPEDESGRRVCVEVQDNGCGIDPKDQERVFQANVRGDGQRVPGGGLGLGYGRRIAAEIGAALTLVESQPKAGSLFRLSLPCGGPPDAARPDAAPEGETR